MMAWHADGQNSYSEDYWSVRKAAPKVDKVNDLKTTFTVSEDGTRVIFMTRRKLDTGDQGEDYLIPLNTEIDMVYAVRYRDSTWQNHDFREAFKMTFKESYGNYLIPSIDIERPKSRIAITTDTG